MTTSATAAVGTTATGIQGAATSVRLAASAAGNRLQTRGSSRLPAGRRCAALPLPIGCWYSGSPAPAAWSGGTIAPVRLSSTMSGPAAAAVAWASAAQAALPIMTPSRRTTTRLSPFAISSTTAPPAAFSGVHVCSRSDPENAPDQLARGCSAANAGEASAGSKARAVAMVAH